jgi:hypothetical protein
METGNDGSDPCRPGRIASAVGSGAAGGVALMDCSRCDGTEELEQQHSGARSSAPTITPLTPNVASEPAR